MQETNILTEADFIEALHQFDNRCLDEGLQFYDITTLYEASMLPFTSEEKTEIKRAIDNGSTPDAVAALVQQKSYDKDPTKKALIAKLKEDFENAGDIDLVDVVNNVLEWINDSDYVLSPDDVKSYINELITTYDLPYSNDEIFNTALEEGDLGVCEFCDELYSIDELHETDSGKLCDHCIDGLISHGESVWVKRN